MMVYEEIYFEAQINKQNILLEIVLCNYILYLDDLNYISISSALMDGSDAHSFLTGSETALVSYWASNRTKISCLQLMLPHSNSSFHLHLLRECFFYN